MFKVFYTLFEHLEIDISLTIDAIVSSTCSTILIFFFKSLIRESKDDKDFHCKVYFPFEMFTPKNSIEVYPVTIFFSESIIS